MLESSVQVVQVSNSDQSDNSSVLRQLLYLLTDREIEQ